MPSGDQGESGVQREGTLGALLGRFTNMTLSELGVVAGVAFAVPTAAFWLGTQIETYNLRDKLEDQSRAIVQSNQAVKDEQTRFLGLSKEKDKLGADLAEAQGQALDLQKQMAIENQEIQDNNKNLADDASRESNLSNQLKDTQVKLGTANVETTTAKKEIEKLNGELSHWQDTPTLEIESATYGFGHNFRDVTEDVRDRCQGRFSCEESVGSPSFPKSMKWDEDFAPNQLKFLSIKYGCGNFSGGDVSGRDFDKIELMCPGPPFNRVSSEVVRP